MHIATTISTQSWFSAAELADLKLPGLPGIKRKINERALDERWAFKVDARGAPLARPRAGRGGGLEYHVDVLPASARLELVKRGIVTPINSVTEGSAQSRDQSWAWFERQPEKVKAEARQRASAIDAVERIKRSGITASVAVSTVASEMGISQATIWNWINMVAGISPADWLPQLASKRRGGGVEAQIDEGAWTFLKSDYLRLERPTFAACYRRLVDDYAAPRGLTVPSMKTLQRKLEREIDPRVIMLKREGEEALRRMLPAQERSVADLSALELVNIDGHKVDVFVQWPDGRVARPIIIAIQDVYSRKYLAYRIADTESVIPTRLALADLFRDYGIPRGCVLDNGRAFASKWITGGAKTRFRFKVKGEEPVGILTALGVRTHWTIPYRGQSKPIERGFRDFCDAIAKHPAFAGAYTGNKPDAKPENYGSRAVPMDLFRAVFAREVARHNARPGRRTEIAAGRSFDDAFNESYARSAIGKATPEQLRMALLAAEQVRCDRNNGSITVFGNRYWSPDLSRLAGSRVTVRFDPDDLLKDVHVYDAAGGYVCSAPVLEAVGFLDADAARIRARQEAEWRKATRRAVELEQLLSADELASMCTDYVDEAETPAPTIVRPVRVQGRSIGNTALAQLPEASAEIAFIDRFADTSRRLRVVE